MKTPTFRGIIKNGKLTLARKDLFQLYVGTLDGNVTLEVKKVKRTRNILQNALYWVWVHQLAEFVGSSDKEMHETLKSMFRNEIRYITNPETGEVKELTIIKSTTTMTVSEFSEYMQRVQQFGAELGIVLKSNNEL